MNREKVALSLMGSIYDAVEYPELWSSIMEKLADAMHGTVTCFSIHQQGSAGVAVAARMDPSFQQSYSAHYDSVNIHLARARHLLKPGAVISTSDVCTDEEVLRSEYYDGWLRPQDVFHLTGGVVLQEGYLLALVNSFRPHRAGPFRKEDISLLRVLMPHLQRAARLHQRLGTLGAGAEALNHLTTGVIFTTTSGVALLFNEISRTIIAQKDGIEIARDGRIRASGKNDAVLHALIRGSSDASEGRSLHAGGSLLLKRSSGKRPYLVVVSPVHGSRFQLSSLKPSAVLFITDPEMNSEVDKSVGHMYGLTTAESRLVGRLVQGESLVQAAAQLGVSHNTVRTHLQRIYGKTNTRHQTELLRLLLCTGSTILR